jgi:hypothetical protein
LDKVKLPLQTVLALPEDKREEQPVDDMSLRQLSSSLFQVYKFWKIVHVEARRKTFQTDIFPVQTKVNLGSDDLIFTRYYHTSSLADYFRCLDLHECEQAIS